MIIRSLAPDDILSIELQPMQAAEAGTYDARWAAAIAAAPNLGWAAESNGRLVACAGFCQNFPTSAVAWALFAPGVRGALTGISRMARRAIAEAKWDRIEATVRADWPAAIAWARLIGLEQICVLRKYGPLAIDHLLFERVR